MRLLLSILAVFSPVFLSHHFTPQERRVLQTEYFLQNLMGEISSKPKTLISKVNKEGLSSSLNLSLRKL